MENDNHRCREIYIQCMCLAVTVCFLCNTDGPSCSAGVPVGQARYTLYNELHTLYGFVQFCLKSKPIKTAIHCHKHNSALPVSVNTTGPRRPQCNDIFGEAKMAGCVQTTISPLPPTSRTADLGCIWFTQCISLCALL